MQFWIKAVHQNEKAIAARLLKPSNSGQEAKHRRAAAEKKRAEKRLAELDSLIARIYEDRTAEVMTARNFSMLSQKYQQEQDEQETKIQTLTARLDESRQQTEGVEKWIDLLRQFSSPTELTAELLNALVEKILVHEATKDEDGSRVQEVEIFYRFVGKID